MKNKNKLLLYPAISIVAAVIIYLLYPVYHPNSSINPEVDVDYIKKKTESFLIDQKIPLDKQYINVFTAKNQALIKDIQRKFGLKTGNDLLKKTLPAYFFEVNLINETGVTISSNSNSKDRKGREDRVAETNLLNFDFRGKVFYFSRVISDSVKMPEITLAEAKKLVQDFALKYSAVSDIVSNVNSKDSTINKFSDSNKEGVQLVRGIHKFYWEKIDSVSNTTVKINATVLCNTITRFSVDYSVNGLAPQQDENTVMQILEALIYLVVLILIAVTGYKKIRAFEIGYKNALLVGILSGLSFAIFILMQMGSDLKGEVWIPIVATFIFWGGLIFVIWAVSEAVVRELWREKFHVFDVLMKGDLLNSKIGENIIIGGSFGIILLAVYLCVISFLDQFINIQIAPGDEVLRMYSNKYVFLYFFNFNLHMSVFYIIVFIAFVFTSLNKKYLGVASSSAFTILLWGLIHKGDITPFYYSVIIHFAMGAVLLYIFYRHEVFTAIFALCTMTFFSNFLQLFFIGNGAYNQWQVIPLLAVIGVIVYSVTSFRTKNLITDINTVAPVYAVHITERQRLQRELEIAREVQMSFLPRRNPEFYGIDVAAQCLPAMEVGGDYYDFIEFGNDQLGIVVGDVSGKGTQAAFYMTLSKGFLKAIAKTSSSPKEVLIKMNNMFYENVERGNFITMVLGIFDMKNRNFMYASAGHNHVIYFNRETKKAEYLPSKGLALGLEKGDIFAKTITEHTITFSPHDVFIFYTDGFPEAMNKKREEFGEDKMLDVINGMEENASFEILESYFKLVKNHIGKALQHDDMSMVTIKIK